MSFSAYDPDRRDFSEPHNGESEQARRERSGARADLEELRKRFHGFATASRQFALSMRERVGERRRLNLQYTIGRTLARSADLDSGVREVLRILGQSLGQSFGVFWAVDEAAGALRCSALWRAPFIEGKALEEACRRVNLPRGVGLPGRVWASRMPEWVENVREDGSFTLAAAAQDSFGGAFAFPVEDGDLYGVLELFSREVVPPDESLLLTGHLIGRQLGQFMERKRMEQEREQLLLREHSARIEAEATRERISDILESIGDAFFALDQKMRFSYINREAERLWGRPRESLLGCNLGEAFPQTVGSESYRAIERAAKERTAVRFELVSPVIGRWIFGTAYPASDGVSVYFRDITSLREAQEERERLLLRERVARAQAEERRSIGRELHDRVAHSLGVVYQSLQLHDALKERNPDAAEARLELAQQTVKDVLDSTRDLSQLLHRQEVRRGLETALKDLLDEVVPKDIHCWLVTKGDESILPPHVADQLYLILREAVRNAVAHSDCSKMEVGFGVFPEEVTSYVEDDGKGFDPEATGGGAGLDSMRERAELLGAVLEISSTPGSGSTRIHVRVPLEH